MLPTEIPNSVSIDVSGLNGRFFSERSSPSKSADILVDLEELVVASSTQG